jgi:RimJ/RimL family protein N-acetyltransferase
LRIIWGREQTAEGIANWCASHIGLTRPFQPPYRVMGVFDEELVGAVVFNNWQPEAGVIELHSAATTPRWLTRRVLWEMFNYVFNVAGCQMAVTRVSERNARLLRIFTAYGFEHVTIPRLRGREEAERIFWLTDDAWKRNGFHKENA